MHRRRVCVRDKLDCLMFSSRLPSLAPNPFSRAVSRARASGRQLFDLTETNPTIVGIDVPPDLLVPLAHPDGRTYAPDPRGLRAARESVAREYRRSGLTVDPDRIVLTPGTSDAYGLIFKLLCDPGDDVLTPVPSYPLFDLLTRFEGVASRAYPLDRAGHWRIDRTELERAITGRTRAVLVVSPNNPTGSMLHRDEYAWLTGLCAARGLAIIADEVFGDYRLRAGTDVVSAAGESRALTFTLGGLSKSVGLPQVKVSWTLVGGPDRLVEDALQRLDVLSDTYLGVSTPAQLALPALLDAGRPIRRAILERVSGNLDRLCAAAQACPGADVHLPDGGWSAVLRVPAVEPEEVLAERLLDEAGVVVHPGYFFDFPCEAFLVVSLLPPPEVFAEGVARLLSTLREAG